VRRWIVDPAMTTHVARAIAALGQCVTVLVTWPLWSARQSPPLLPLGPSMPVPFGHALIATALSAVVWPRGASVAHSLVLALAMAADATRVQPTAYTFAALIVGTSFGPRGWVFARASIGALYFYAGFNKLLSPGWFSGTAPWLLTALSKAPSAEVSRWFPWVIAGGETLLGLFVFVPRTRKLAALGAIAMHLGILYDLGPLGHNWNRSVWPWNSALALLAPLLLWPWHGERVRQTVERSHRIALLASAWLIIAPLLWHVGLWPAYFSHHLYSEDLPTSRWCASDRGPCANERANDEVYQALEVPLPPSVPIIRAYFLARCREGEQLEIRESRSWFIRRGRGEITVPCARR
jgi:uncharacterized membrane protein YphA (DoxX/SURF4 family)